MALEFTADIGFVPLVVVTTFFAHMFMSMKVVAARKKYKVPYPAMYAIESENKDAKLFNCIQRGHQNFLEVISFFLALLIFAGLQFPKVATSLGFMWLAARILYFVDYSTGDPKKRVRGMAVSMFCMMGLVVCCILFSVSQLSGWSF